jgi:alkanesulfonate monooxygenase SsuD/methylene tetrahydromethanopterin reductase-like flavin-dependent oxidoreductase (luciferase family)
VEAKYRGYAQHGLPTARESLAEGVEAMMRDPFVIGSPDECLERLARFRNLGVTHLALRLFWPEMEQREVLEMIELTGATLVPALSRL